MSSSILFFQASATIIPTLFIALAFTLKAPAPGDEHVLGVKKGDREGYGVTLFVLASPISSEAVALATLAANRPTTVAEYWVLLGIGILLGYLVLAITLPLRHRSDDRMIRQPC